jgi:hypothetical protein
VTTHDHDDLQHAADARPDWFLRAAGGLADLGSPFYREERQRDVWNEASAVGLQLVVWLGMAAAAAMVWIGGTAAMPYAVTTFLIMGAASWITIIYAARLGVRVDDPRKVLRPRLLPYALLVAAFAAGVLHAAPSGGFEGGLLTGAAVGALLGVVVLTVGALRARRRAATDRD